MSTFRVTLSITVAAFFRVHSQPGATPPPDAVFCDYFGNDASYQETIVDYLNMTDLNTTENLTEVAEVVRHIESSGCPNHVSPCLKPHCVGEEWEKRSDAIVLDTSIDLPAYPCIADEPFPTVCAPGPLGITLGGILIFGLFGRPPCEDAIIFEGYTFDGCGGHATGTGKYHYHSPPACLLEQVGDAKTPSPQGHSPQIGWAYDGFPIHGPHGLDGGLIYKCDHPMADPADCLDECNGHGQHEHPEGFAYHYHVTGPVGDLQTIPFSPLPDTGFAPYTIGCLKGISLEPVKGMPERQCSNISGTADQYIPVAKDGITELYVREFTRRPTSSPSDVIIAGPDGDKIFGETDGAFYVYSYFISLSLLFVSVLFV